MTTTQGRRKHNACLFRLRQNCPFRKLRKNTSDDAMDTDPVVQAGPSLGALAADPSSVVVHAAASGSCVRQRNPSEGSSDVSMELDSGVDPETGERAMG